MHTLKQIVRTLTQYQHPYSIQVLGKIQEAPTQISKFFEGIRNGNFDSDATASKVLLNCSPSHQTYKDLKVKFRNSMLNTVFFINTKKIKASNKYSRIALHCHKRWTAAKILDSLGAKSAAVELAKQVLTQAHKAEISHLIVDTTLYLRFYYGAVMGDQKKFDEYNDLHHKYNHILTWENKAQEYYTQLALYFTKSKAEKSDIHNNALQFYLELEKHIYKYKTHKLLYFGGLIKLITCMSINDYKASIEVCEEILELLDKNPLYPTVGKATFMHQQLICCIQLRQFEEGERLAENALKYLKPGQFNWFKHQELFFLLSTHTQNYNRAYEVVKETLGTKGFNGLDSKSKEVWKIYEMYTNYLISQGRIDTGEPKKKVRLAKFLNELPGYSQDKRGLNIAILVIQILFYVQRKDYDSAINRIEAIQKYCSRYLKKDNDFRSNCFIRMILQLPNASFHPAAALRKAEKYYDKLKSHPIDVANQAHSIEIVPYEDLWEIAIGSLGRHRRR